MATQRNMDNGNLRILIRSKEFDAFYFAQPLKVQEKFQYVMDVLMNVYNVPIKFIKHLENTDLYEMRISLGTNEYRTILFAIDNPNIIQATTILLLNCFLKKSTKDYKKQIEIANKILNDLSL